MMEKTAKAAANAAAVFGVVAAAVSRTSLAGVAPPPLPMMNGFERWRERKRTPPPGCVDPPRADPRSRRGTL